MIYLFIHQNLPGQYVHVIRRLLSDKRNVIYGISRAGNATIAGVRSLTYRIDTSSARFCHPLSVDIDIAIRNGAEVAQLCRSLRDQGVRPDLIVAHAGWGEALFVKDVFPDSPLLSYFEFYYHASGADVGFDPEFESAFFEPEKLRVRNAISLMTAEVADWGHTPTQWQRSLLPPALRKRVSVIHEGVDTQYVCPDAKAFIELPQGGRLTRKDEVITYVARNLEPYRGFHTFMRALPEILRRRPRAQVVIVGGEEVGYGSPPPPGMSYRQMFLQEVADAIDPQRVHWFAKLPFADYLRVLQVSSVHVYLTYPFVLSWSFIEALSAGCLVVGSATPPVMEVLKDGENGLLTDFFSPAELAQTIDRALRLPYRGRAIRTAARRTAVDRFDLNQRLMPCWLDLFEKLIQGRRPALNP